MPLGLMATLSSLWTNLREGLAEIALAGELGHHPLEHRCGGGHGTPEDGAPPERLSIHGG
jgi:hypothetical protein